MPDLFGYSEADTARIAAAVRAFEAGRIGKNRELSPADRNYTRIPFRNDSGETVPAYGVMRVVNKTTIDARPIYTIGKPNTTFQRRYLVNSPTEVIDGGRGWGTWLWHADYVLYDSGSGTPAFGEEWGAQNGTWTLAKNRPGFLIDGGNETNPHRTIAMQHLITSVLAQTDGAIDLESSGTLDVLCGAPGSETASGQTISSAFSETMDCEDNTRVTCSWFNGKPYFSPTRCAE